MRLTEKTPLWAAILLLFLIASCATETAAPPARFKTTVPDHMILIEAEAFRLAGSRIIEDPQASDGKAVTLLTPRAFCSYELDLPPGTYVAAARVRAVDGEHNELYLSTLKSTAALAAGAVVNRFAYCAQVMEFTLVKNVKDFIQFAAFSSLNPKGKAGLTVDYIVICEKSSWDAAPLELE